MKKIQEEWGFGNSDTAQRFMQAVSNRGKGWQSIRKQSQLGWQQTKHRVVKKLSLFEESVNLNEASASGGNNNNMMNATMPNTNMGSDQYQ